MRAIIFSIFLLAVSSQYIEASAPFLEDFEGNWTTNWLTDDQNTDYGLDFWGTTDRRSHGGNHSVYCASSIGCFGENTTIYNIPDSNAQQALCIYIDFSDIPIDAIILKVDVNFSITHKRTTDLTVNLWSPDNKKGACLWDGKNSTSLENKTISNITNFNGRETVNGKWRFEIYDTAKDITGTVNSCWIKIYYSSASSNSSSYDSGMSSYLINKEPLDLSAFSVSNPPALSFWYWLKTDTGTDINNNWCDFLSVWGGRLVNNSWEDQDTLWGKGEKSGTWTQAFVDLSQYAGKSNVHLGFWFTSDTTFQNEGAYIDDGSIITQPDLVVTDISVDSSVNIQVPKIRFEIRNEGSTIKDYVAIKVYVDEERIWSGGRTTITAGGYANGEFEQPFFNGAHTIKVEVDSDKRISESNENNNVRNYSFSWTGLPDLKITNVSVDPLDTESGKPVKIKFNLENKGNANAASPTVSIFLNGTISKTLPFTGIFQPGGTSSSGEFSIVPSGGINEIKIVVDPDNKIVECDESNNISISYVTCPKLETKIKNIKIDSDYAQPGNKITISGRLISSKDKKYITNQPIKIYFNSKVIATGTTILNGDFSCEYFVPTDILRGDKYKIVAKFDGDRSYNPCEINGTFFIPLIDSFSITPNSPFDPFNVSEERAISYKLYEEADISIEIHTFPGSKKVKTFNEGRKITGTVVWSGVIDDNDFGIIIAPDGFYTIRLKATNIKDTTKAEEKEESVVVKAR